MDDQRRYFKRRFAPNLLALRAESSYGSQVELAAAVNARAPTSEATYRRWEDVDEPHLPDAWQIAVLCDLLGCEPDELVNPAELSPKERELLRKIARGKRRGLERADGGG